MTTPTPIAAELLPGYIFELPERGTPSVSAVLSWPGVLATPSRLTSPRTSTPDRTGDPT